jgi:hypothetical protein
MKFTKTIIALNFISPGDGDMREMFYLASRVCVRFACVHAHTRSEVKHLPHVPISRCANVQ